MQTADKIANACLSYIGTEQVDDPGVPAGALQIIADCMNASLETMRVKCPQMFRQSETVNFSGAVTGTVGVTNGSTVATLVTLPAPQAGCTISISGDTAYNEIRPAVSGSGYQLLVPFQGPTGTQSATCYGDSVLLNTAVVDHLIGAVLLHDRRPIATLNSKQEWLLAQSAYRMGDYAQGLIPNSAPIVRRQPAPPESIFLNTFYDPALTKTEYQVRVCPLPSGHWAVDVDLELIPNDIQVSDIQGNSFNFPVPGGRVYTIFRALTLWNWSGTPFYKDKESRPVIQANYAEAIQQLENFRPAASAQPKLVVSGYLVDLNYSS